MCIYQSRIMRCNCLSCTKYCEYLTKSTCLYRSYRIYVCVCVCCFCKTIMRLVATLYIYHYHIPFLSIFSMVLIALYCVIVWALRVHDAICSSSNPSPLSLPPPLGVGVLSPSYLPIASGGDSPGSPVIFCTVVSAPLI